MNRLIIISDIHANLSALEKVFEDASVRYEYDSVAILGDIINYGMRPDEVIGYLGRVSRPIIVNLAGNHENALLNGDCSRFSTERGKEVLAFTRERLGKDSVDYIRGNLVGSGMTEMEIGGHRVLFVHGTLSDPFWGKMSPEEMRKAEYAGYDYVISGHSHVPAFVEIFHECAGRPEYRNKKRTVFLNPGSVGQPRNHNPRAHYLYADFESETFHFNSVEYDVAKEQSLYEGEKINVFYKDRLTNGI